MKTNEKTLRAAMDRRLSFLDSAPSCRAEVLSRIAREEPPAGKKISLALVAAAVLALISAAALAASPSRLTA